MEYLGLADVVMIASAVLGTEPESLLRTSRIGGADSTVNTPAASFGGVEFHPGLARKVAVLDSGLWDDFDVAVLGAQRLLQPGRWCRQVDVGLEVDSGGEHFDAECVEPVALV